MTTKKKKTKKKKQKKTKMNGLISKPVDVNTLVEHITKLAGL